MFVYYENEQKGGEFNVYSPHFVEVNSEGQIIYFEYLPFRGKDN